MSTLLERHCRPRKGDVPLDRAAAEELLNQLSGWSIDNDKVLSREYRFKNYYETMAFVNVVAWIAHREDHHPDMEVGYNRCCVRFSTHSVGGLSENDFICAAYIDTIRA
ncbi:MAG: 4a-hydroxytetrahydrobiopterin dehydratase [Gammaproteobacteria bacterium]|nr:MAG: 4a-hydroxytetrahydrobiopterin dehydratase [Gammaproteobacteria bacterium]